MFWLTLRYGPSSSTKVLVATSDILSSDSRWIEFRRRPHLDSIERRRRVYIRPLWFFLCVMLAQQFHRRRRECHHGHFLRPDVSGVAELVATSTLPGCQCALIGMRHADNIWGDGWEFRFQYKMHFQSVIRSFFAKKECKFLDVT